MCNILCITVYALSGSMGILTRDFSRVRLKGGFYIIHRQLKFCNFFKIKYNNNFTQILEMTSYSQVKFFLLLFKIKHFSKCYKLHFQCNHSVKINKSFTSYIKNIEINSKILIQLLLFFYSFQCTSLK